MKNNLALVVGFLLMISPATTFAASIMPNYVGTDFKQPANCIVPPDHGIYGYEGSNYILVGCITDNAWQASIQRAQTRTYLFGAYNQPKSVTVLGQNETCPWMNGCAVDPTLIH